MPGIRGWWHTKHHRKIKNPLFSSLTIATVKKINHLFLLLFLQILAQQ
jgi:hypothetical protein